MNIEKKESEIVKAIDEMRSAQRRIDNIIKSLSAVDALAWIGVPAAIEEGIDAACRAYAENRDGARKGGA